MTDFESSLTAALRAQAEEIAMSVDQQAAAEELKNRLDRTDRQRRRRYAAGAVAVAAAAAVVIAVVVTRAQDDQDDATVIDRPPAVEPFSASGLEPPTSLELPAWTAEADTTGTGATVYNFEQLDACSGFDGASPCPADADLKLRLLSIRYFYEDDAVVQDPSYADYVAHLDGLEPLGIATISDRASVTVGGRPATVMSLSVLTDAPGALACADPGQPALECSPLIAGRGARFAVVDQGAGVPPMVFYLSLNGDAADRAERFAELDTMLETVGFDEATTS